MAENITEISKTILNPKCEEFIPGQQLEVIDRKALPIRLERVLGNGKTAVVEMVSHTATNERFALKIYQRRRGRRSESVRHAFEDEISTIKRLSSHAHMIRFCGSFMSNCELGIFLNPVANEGDLAQYLYRALEYKMTSEQENILDRAFGCLADGLAFIHKHRIRHQDIKPPNILIDHGHVIYTDFGDSFDADQDDTTSLEYVGPFTRRYAAPEVIAHSRRNRKSDVYSLGCVFLEILDALYQRVGLRELDTVDYCEKLNQVRPLLLEASTTEEARRDLFRITHDMLDPNLTERIDISNVLRRIVKLANRPRTLFCNDCSARIEFDDTTQDDVVSKVTETLRFAEPAIDIVFSEAEITSSTKKSTTKRKKKAVLLQADFGVSNSSSTSSGVYTSRPSRSSRYYCTTCGELGHDSSKCPNECWACGGLYHKSAECPDKCWTCDEVGHHRHECPNECDACGEIGHPTDECPNRCWTCGDVGHYARDCADLCFVCGRLGHDTRKCRGKCHKCGKIGHWKRDCDDACFECGELGHWKAQCPHRKRKGRRRGMWSRRGAPGHSTANDNRSRATEGNRDRNRARPRHRK